ncbi:RNA polymerase sigma factor [Halalkalibacter krulwichiae]|uniref:ECF RNA polymerase sigma factor SigW n=1 Tax=Halalkalibacter krulwichiae TaxID=199441 RepID=A0A1X9MIX3_9BACI|nr:sigma-70 family RNA polymerase sigma factor [Halalkalibacter krulwichiae]ARK31611.1 ECF RNA polymerase sigma factor SigW [Halalkalibacter krulwichiae]
MEELVQRLKEKDEAAFKQCLELFSNECLRLASLVLKDRYEAEDVVQDAFVAAFDRIHQLQDSKKFKQWLVSIVINECRKRTRRWSFKHVFLRHADDHIEEGTVEDTPETEILRLLDGQSLVKAVQTLDQKYREIIALYYFQEFSVKEIVSMIDEKESTVKSRLARARKQLKDRLEGEQND